MRRLAVVAALPFVTGCGGGDDRPPAREAPRAVVARWVKEGDCRLWTDRNVKQGYRSVAEGRRACQEEADRTPVRPYRVQATFTKRRDAIVVLTVPDRTRLVFFLVPHGATTWRIDGYEERRPEKGAPEASEVEKAVEDETGIELARDPKLSSAYYEALFTRRPDPELGSFTIFVAESAKQAKEVADPGDRRYGNLVLSTQRDPGPLEGILRELAAP